MSEFILKAGPVLISRSWETDPATKVGAWQEADVTARAHEHLFECVTLEEDVTLADIFKLVGENPVLQAVFRRDYAAELCAEAAKGATAPVDEQPDDALAYLELYQHWGLDTGTGTYGAMHRLHFHGLSVPQSVDRPDKGLVAGERIQWGISMTNPREMLHLTVRVNPQVKVCEDDVDAKGYGRELACQQNPFVTLGQVLHGILWELSFYGAPAEAAEVSEDLRAQMDEVTSGAVELVSADNFFDSLDRPGVAALFDSVGTCSPSDVSRALHALEDEANAAEGLAAALGESVVVKPAYRALAARAFRKAFREAR